MLRKWIPFDPHGPAWLPACALLVAALAPVGCSAPGTASPVPALTADLHWPPRLDEPYPDLSLLEPDGTTVRLSDFRGKTLLIEPIAVDCPACQAWAGANDPAVGPLRACRPQAGLQSIEKYVDRYGGGVSLDDPRLIYIQLLLYDWTRSRAPSLEEAREWAEHFGSGRPNHLVLVGDDSLIGNASYDMIPGFQLVDPGFVLRVDSSGHHPRHDLYSELLPRLGSMIEEAPAVAMEPTRVGDAFPDFTLRDDEDRVVSFASLRDGRPAFVYFFSGCCGHCTDQLPRVGEAVEGLDPGEAVVGVQYLGNGEACRKLRSRHGLPGTILADADGAVCRRFGVGDFTVFRLDADGVVRYRGPLDGAEG